MRTANSAAQRRKNGFLCNSITIGEPHDQGLVFKWGSLVGIRQPTSGANATLPFTVADTAFVPNEFTGRITDDWASVPWCAADFTNYGDPAVDHLTTVHNPALGVGDICRYMGEVDGATWRMPTAKDWEDIYGSNQPNGGRDTILGNGWAAGNFYPLHGRAFGAGQSYARINYGTLDTDVRVENVDPWINGAVFIPPSGLREAGVGAIGDIGSSGYLWSSTASTMDHGYFIQFVSTVVAPQIANARTYAFSVRCIRE